MIAALDRALHHPTANSDNGSDTSHHGKRNTQCPTGLASADTAPQIWGEAKTWKDHTVGIDLETARMIVDATRAAGRQFDMQALTVVVLDTGGHLVAAEREDGASMSRFDIAFGKAYGALALGVGSRALMTRAEQQPYFVTAAATALQGRLVPVPGGVLLRNSEEVLLGAVGVSGDTSDNDELAAVTGAEAADLVPQSS